MELIETRSDYKVNHFGKRIITERNVNLFDARVGIRIDAQGKLVHGHNRTTRITDHIRITRLEDGDILPN